jgi:hypothetical protein
MTNIKIKSAFSQAFSDDTNKFATDFWEKLFQFYSMHINENFVQEN